METKGDDSVLMPSTQGLVGFRFSPTDEELVVHYLNPKVNGKLGAIDIIPDISDPYSLEPWELADLSKLKSSDPMFFFAHIWKSGNAFRSQGATKSGYWQRAGSTRNVYSKSGAVGTKKNLAYFRGKPLNGEKTGWVMDLYSLVDDERGKGGTLQDTYILCKLFNKSNKPEASDGVKHVTPSGSYPDKEQTSISSSHQPPSVNSTTEYLCFKDVDSRELGSDDETEEVLVQVALEWKLFQLRKTLLLYGKSYEFEKEMLIQLWMALGIITAEPMEKIGAKYFEKLVSEGYISVCVTNSLYKVNTEKPNIFIQRQECTILGNGSQNDDTPSTETLHVSILSDEIDDMVIFRKLERCNKLRTLLFIGGYGSRLQRVPRDLFLRFESLVALDLSGSHIKELPSSARKMIHLRYLDLSWTFIEHLPERIDRFGMLQTLKLKGCTRLCKLPKEMKKVIALRHLDLDVLRQLTAFPKGIGALVNLRTLSAFPIGTEEGHKITELRYLNNLSGEFCIAKLENVESAVEANEALLINKKKVRKLELRWSRCQFQGPKIEDEAILKNLRPYSRLEELQIICYHGTRLPNWIDDFTCYRLVSLTMLKCKNVFELPRLEKLPSLETLELDGFSSVTKIDWSGRVDHVAFPKLQKLAVDGMPNLETWTKAYEHDYPYLVQLSVKDCPKLPELPSLLYLTSLENLELSGCSKLAFVQENRLSNSLQQLIVEECPVIVERCTEGGQDWYKVQHVPTIWIDQVAIQPTCEDDWEANTEQDDESEDSLHSSPMSKG